MIAQELAALPGEVVVTDYGQEITKQPGVAAQMADVLLREIGKPDGTGPYPNIASARHGRVDEFPDRPDICVKMSSPQISYEAGRRGDVRKGRAEDLVLQTRTLDWAHHRFAGNPEANVVVPAQYVGYRAGNGVSAMIQQRLPDYYVSLSNLLREQRIRDNVGDIRQNVFERVCGTVGGLAYLCLFDDIVTPDRRLRGGNILFAVGDGTLRDVESTPLAIIDQPCRPSKAARAFLARHGTPYATSKS